ncbi:MAG: hypothetical protein QOF83_2106 [Solirubrobacteraceae bacterium]|nr:hypothetical protein [Solirubrobacteraceae bacterium]
MERGPVRAVTFHMRASSRLAQLAVCAAALSAAGCAAGGAPPPTPHVNVSISAPTSGATVGVHKVTITGTVTPAGAQVVVDGQRAKVTGSSFSGTMYVSAANQKIVVSAAANGYVASQASTTVTYSPNVAHELVAAAAAVNNPPASSSTASPKVTTSVLTQAFGLSVASVTKKTKANAPNPPASSPSGSGGSSPSSAPTSSGNGTAAPSGSSSTPAPAPAPTPTPAEIAAAIHDAWVHGCIKVQAGGSVVPYCTCTYTHLAGQLQTRTSAEHVLKEMVPYLRTGDFRTLPAFIRRAVDACASKLPPLDPVTGKPVVSSFPGATHTAAPATNQGTQTDPAATPPPPAPAAPTPVSPVTPVPNIRSAFQQINSTLTPNLPTSVTPADADSLSQADSRAATSRLAPHSGDNGLRQARTVAKALSYALVWVGNHDGPGPYPYWDRVQRRLRRRLSAALKLAA